LVVYGIITVFYFISGSYQIRIWSDMHHVARMWIGIRIQGLPIRICIHSTKC